jgi:hypothetical protein
MQPTRSPNPPSGAQRIVALPRARARPRTVRRLATLAENGTLARIGRWSELLVVIERHGNLALTFIWRNKGALTVTTVGDVSRRSGGVPAVPPSLVPPTA